MFFPTVPLNPCLSNYQLQITNYTFFSVTISEKSAIVENSLNKLCNNANRFARTFSSSTITITLSKNVSTAGRMVAISAKADTVAGKRFEVAYNRYVIGRITLDNLFLAQSEKDQAVTQFVQALRGYWTAHYRLRRLTLFDFATNQPIE